MKNNYLIFQYRTLNGSTLISYVDPDIWSHLHPHLPNLYPCGGGCGLTVKLYGFVSNPQVCHSVIKPVGCDMGNGMNPFKITLRSAKLVEKWTRYYKIFM
jgi:hypothetical protein